MLLAKPQVHLLCFKIYGGATGVVHAIISVFGRQRQESILEFEVSLSDLHNEFQASQGYTMSPCLGKRKDSSKESYTVQHYIFSHSSNWFTLWQPCITVRVKACKLPPSQDRKNIPVLASFSPLSSRPSRVD